MGKDLKGKELGTGISQRKDGTYTARYTDRTGKRRQKYFNKLQDCRNWIAEERFQNEHGNVLNCENPTVDAWYQYWIEEIKGNNIRFNTIRNYKIRYRISIQPIMGNMLITDIKPLHCQNVLNRMSGKYSSGVVAMTRLVMLMMFDSAAENELIQKNPVTKSIKCTSTKASKQMRALTVSEQKTFLEETKNLSHYNQCAFVLQTGLRCGELVGLRWDDVDFKNRVIHIRRTMEYIASYGWRVGEPKTKSSIRDIPLTQEAVNILKDQREKAKSLKVIPMEFSDTVFLSKKGKPIRTNTYDTMLISICERIGIERFSMHALRHTFATRCIEAGMRPKTLQIILGHSNIGITMNLYVHVTDDEKAKELENVEKKLKLV